MPFSSLFYYYIPNGMWNKLKVCFKNTFWVSLKDFLSASNFVFENQPNVPSSNLQRSACSSSTFPNLKLQYVAVGTHLLSVCQVPTILLVFTNINLFNSHHKLMVQFYQSPSTDGSVTRRGEVTGPKVHS